MDSTTSNTSKKGTKMDETLLCPNCRKAKLVAKVYVVYRQQIVGKFDSALKAWDYALDNRLCPVVLTYVNICERCSSEQIIFERIINERID